MTKKKVWTIVAYVKLEFPRGYFEVQGNGSYILTLNRLKIDDPIWHSSIIKRKFINRWPNKKFKRGLSIKFTAIED